LTTLCDTVTTVKNQVEQAFGQWIVNEVSPENRRTDSLVMNIATLMTRDALESALKGGDPWYKVLLQAGSDEEVDARKTSTESDAVTVYSTESDWRETGLVVSPGLSVIDQYVQTIPKLPEVSEADGCVAMVAVGLPFDPFSHEYMRGILDNRYTRKSFDSWPTESFGVLAVSILRERNEVINSVNESMALKKKLSKRRIVRLVKFMELWEGTVLKEYDFEQLPLVYKLGNKRFATSNVLYPTHATALRWQNSLARDGEDIDWGTFVK